MYRYDGEHCSYSGDGCATGPATPTQQAMLPAYSNGIEYSGFYPTYPTAITGSMLPNYGTPVSSLYPNPSFLDISTVLNESSPPSDPSQKHRSPEEHSKYLQKRAKNNEAAKLSRKKRTTREKDLQFQKQQLTVHNQELQHQMQKLFMEKQSLQARVATQQTEIEQLTAQLNQKFMDKENKPFTEFYPSS